MTISPSKYVSKGQRTRHARKAKKANIASEAGQALDKQKPYVKARPETLSAWARRGEALIKAPFVMGAAGRGPYQGPQNEKKYLFPLYAYDTLPLGEKKVPRSKNTARFFFVGTKKKFHMVDMVYCLNYGVHHFTAS